MIVLDASAGVLALLNSGRARRILETETIHVPHLIDAEVVSALRRLVAAGTLTSADAELALTVWAGVGVVRYATAPLFARVWALRASVTAYDAIYVAVAENLGCELVTADAKLAGANGMRCPVTVVPD